MPPPIARRQWTFVGHRLHFWGRPASHDTVSWQYEGRRHLVDRPPDGDPARQWSVRCAACGETLTYTVHSVAVTRRRRARRWAGTAACFAAGLAVPCAAIVAAGGTVALILLLAVPGPAVGAGFFLLALAAHDIGVTGHRASWPGATRHQVTRVEPPVGE